jgi:hypothetical protein
VTINPRLLGLIRFKPTKLTVTSTKFLGTSQYIHNIPSKIYHQTGKSPIKHDMKWSLADTPY